MRRTNVAVEIERTIYHAPLHHDLCNVLAFLGHQTNSRERIPQRTERNANIGHILHHTQHSQSCIHINGGKKIQKLHKERVLHIQYFLTCLLAEVKLFPHIRHGDFLRSSDHHGAINVRRL